MHQRIRMNNLTIIIKAYLSFTSATTSNMQLSVNTSFPNTPQYDCKSQCDVDEKKAAARYIIVICIAK